MAREIERKFLVRGEAWRGLVSRAKRIRQGYLSREGGLSIRVRIIDDKEAWLTIKSGKAELTRHEFEYAIPAEDGEQLLLLRGGAMIAKTRHIVPWQDLVLEIDVFEDDNAGLVIAEIELDAEDRPLDLPEWLGREITREERYYNSSLIERPFCLWEAHERAGPD